MENISSQSLCIFQKGFNFSQDGPGNRLIYHLQGCNFACPWCSNPEGMSCSSKTARTVELTEVLDEALRCRSLFFGGGGVTFTGGECTLQHSALLSTLTLLREHGINTCIETNGSDKLLSELLPQIDYLIVDLKHPDPYTHRRFTGADNACVLSNLAYIFNSYKQVLVRIPLIGGFNTQPQPFVDFLSAYNTSNARFELLRYHEYGKEKWKTPYTYNNGFVNKETVDEFRQALQSIGLNLITT